MEETRLSHPEFHPAYCRILKALRLVDDGSDIADRLPHAMQPKLTAQIEALDLAGRRLLERVEQADDSVDAGDFALVRERSRQLLRAAQGLHREVEFLDDGPAATSIDALADKASSAADFLLGRAGGDR